MAQDRNPDNLEDLFRGPRDPHRHSKWPYFFRLHGSVLPRMILPLLVLAAWSTMIVCIHQLVHRIGINSVLLTITGFVVGLALSFRSSTAYERYMEGRKYWAQLLYASRQIARVIWVHVAERHTGDNPELGKQDLLAKLAALNLLNAFAVSLKHRLRFEPAVNYADLAPLVSNLKTLAGELDQDMLREEMTSKWSSIGNYLDLAFAKKNPRRLIKQARAKHNLGNIPFEVLNYLSAYFEHVIAAEKTLSTGIHQAQALNMLVMLSEVLAGSDRVVNTPLPIAYSISISQITWAYVLCLPFQLVTYLGWVAIPGTILAGYIIIGLAAIGRELENPFGDDVNDLPLDAYCHELANDIDALTSRPAPLDMNAWMRDGGAKIMWPLSNVEYKVWETKSVEEIRSTLRAKANSVDVKRERMFTIYGKHFASAEYWEAEGGTIHVDAVTAVAGSHEVGGIGH
ncbi:hypothetical protein LTR62_004877 [Meristemomyces frigidus]|uniref:Uncharacterized protein n=1 Tax=Meristemomyces frigidus TaxID=1508187 RepID=A0AAN7TE12_9PEZI|nr:hypothetical protein LTR62_004877 [Meristemomyces frigidus]